MNDSSKIIDVISSNLDKVREQLDSGLFISALVAALVAAFAATFVFMLTPAVRSAATHLEPRLFDFTWALAAFALPSAVGMLMAFLTALVCG